MIIMRRTTIVAIRKVYLNLRMIVNMTVITIMELRKTRNRNTNKNRNNRNTSAYNTNHSTKNTNTHTNTTAGELHPLSFCAFVWLRFLRFCYRYAVSEAAATAPSDIPVRERVELPQTL